MKHVYIDAALDDLENSRASLVLAKEHNADWQRHWRLVADAHAFAQNMVNACERELADVSLKSGSLRDRD